MPESPKQPVWLKVGVLLDGRSTVPARDVHLVYNRNEILYTGAAECPPPVYLIKPGQRDPDAVLPGYTALPGLIEAHAHLFLEGGEKDPARRAEYLQLSDAELLDRALARLGRLLAIGVIAVRDAGDKNGVGLSLQKRCRSANRPAMPYLDSPGAAVHHKGRYGSFMGRPAEDYATIEACVDGRIADGAHRIKLLATGIINFEKGAVTAKPQMSADELRVWVEAAHARGRQTFAHCSGNEGVSNCIAARVDSIEHGFFVDDTQLVQMRDNDIAWVPTFAPVQFQIDHAAEMGWSDQVKSNLQRIVDDHSASLVKAGRLGVRIVAGSDAGSHGVPHGWGLLTELEWMERAGLERLQIVNSATGSGAQRLGFAEDFGVLRPGARSRFILTEHSPLDAIFNLRKAKTVVFDGEIFSSGDSELQAGL